MNMHAMRCRLRQLLFIVLAMMSGALWAAVETPWSTYGTGNQIITDNNWPSYVGGYEFTPVVNGKVSSLGGYFSGAHPVKLYETTTGALLASTTITSNNNWVFANITPVTVMAGVSYTVAAESNTGTAMQTGLNFPLFPVTYGNITINRSVWGFPGSVPNIDVPGAMYGMADIGFEQTPTATGPQFVLVAGAFPTPTVTINPTNPGAVDATLILINSTASDMSLYFTDSNFYELLLIDSNGLEVSSSTRGKGFTQIVTTIPIPAGQQFKLPASVPLTDHLGNPLPAGNYTLMLVLNTTGATGTSLPPGASRYRVLSPLEIR